MFGGLGACLRLESFSGQLPRSFRAASEQPGIPSNWLLPVKFSRILAPGPFRGPSGCLQKPPRTICSAYEAPNRSVIVPLSGSWLLSGFSVSPSWKIGAGSFRYLLRLDRPSTLAKKKKLLKKTDQIQTAQRCHRGEKAEVNQAKQLLDHSEY